MSANCRQINAKMLESPCNTRAFQFISEVLITRRSGVQVPPPQPDFAPRIFGFLVLFLCFPNFSAISHFRLGEDVERTLPIRLVGKLSERRRRRRYQLWVFIFSAARSRERIAFCPYIILLKPCGLRFAWLSFSGGYSHDFQIRHTKGFSAP